MTWNHVRNQILRTKRFLFDEHYIDSHNLSTWLCINVVRRKLILVTDLRVEKLEALLVCGLLERKYYCMRNFYYLIGLQRWYFSSIWNTYVWKLQLTFAGSSINEYGHDLYVIFGNLSLVIFQNCLNCYVWQFRNITHGIYARYHYKSCY